VTGAEKRHRPHQGGVGNAIASMSDVEENVRCHHCRRRFAGAVLAARLSADAETPGRPCSSRAGPNLRPTTISILTDANVVAGSSTFDWHYHTEDAARLGHDIPVPPAV